MLKCEEVSHNLIKICEAVVQSYRNVLKNKWPSHNFNTALKRNSSKKSEEWEPLVMNQNEQTEKEPKLWELTRQSGVVINVLKTRNRQYTHVYWQLGLSASWKMSHILLKKWCRICSLLCQKWLIFTHGVDEESTMHSTVSWPLYCISICRCSFGNSSPLARCSQF